METIITLLGVGIFITFIIIAVLGIMATIDYDDNLDIIRSKYVMKKNMNKHDDRNYKQVKFYNL